MEKNQKHVTLFLPCCFECSFLAATAQIDEPMWQYNCNSIYTSLMWVTRTWSRPGTFAFRALLEKYCLGAKLRLPWWWWRCQAQGLYKRCGNPPFQLWFFFPPKKKSTFKYLCQFLVFWLTVMQILERRFFAKKNLSITTIPTIKNMKFVTLRVSE